ncbi:MAG: RecX family transcriptional regulator [Bacilli bacterium]|nr:RecX family transcriptional regulator [Bacilli bacterium]
MKIKGYRKLKNNEYEITLNENKTIHLYDDVIIKYSLLLKKEITHSELTKILKENDTLEAYYISLRYINKKMRSVFELKKYLENLEFDSKIIDKTIKKLKLENYLNDQLFSRSYINDQYNLTNNGPIKIKKSLNQLGINDEYIEINQDFSPKIKHLINKKIKSNHKLSTNALKINIVKYLSNLGYPKELYISELEKIKADDITFIKKDYERLLKKYKYKYDSNKLKYILKEKLYQKGYEHDTINSIVFEGE